MQYNALGQVAFKFGRDRIHGDQGDAMQLTRSPPWSNLNKTGIAPPTNSTSPLGQLTCQTFDCN